MPHSEASPDVTASAGVRLSDDESAIELLAVRERLIGFSNRRFSRYEVLACARHVWLHIFGQEKIQSEGIIEEIIEHGHKVTITTRTDELPWAEWQL